MNTLNSKVLAVYPIIDSSVRGLCAQPYPRHPKGCPKFNAGHATCPPAAPRFYDVFDIKFPVYAIVNEFDMAGHVSTMQQRHPTWSDAQLRNCLYWQAGARAELRRKVTATLKQESFSGYGFTMCPEAMGVDVHITLLQEGVLLEWPPVNIARQVALIGRIKNTEAVPK